MYNKDMLIGILVSRATTECTISENPNSNLGYRFRLRVHIRATNLLFLQGIERSLAQHNIMCKVLEKESKARNQPLLRISTFDGLIKVCELVPDIEDNNNHWKEFKTIMEIVKNKEHLKLDGLDKILKIKGYIC